MARNLLDRTLATFQLFIYKYLHILSNKRCNHTYLKEQRYAFGLNIHFSNVSYGPILKRDSVTRIVFKLRPRVIRLGPTDVPEPLFEFLYSPFNLLQYLKMASIEVKLKTSSSQTWILKKLPGRI